jgi:hypothetical protein
MLDEEKNAALSDKKKHTWVKKCFIRRKSDGNYCTLYKELAEHQFQYPLQKIRKILKRILLSEKQYH